jgi:hypothetical protein
MDDPPSPAPPAIHFPAEHLELTPKVPLFATPARWTELRAQIQTDPVSAALFAATLEDARAALDLEPVLHQHKGGQLLHSARALQGRVLALGCAYRLTGEPLFAARARAELLAAAALPSWNTEHFLDVAEYALAVAIGLDWLHDALSPSDRTALEDALLVLALRPSFVEPAPWWVHGTNNWTQVCHAGLTAAALAVAHREPQLAARVLARAVSAFPGVAAGYAPDGAYPEGPNYWAYGTVFHVIQIDLLRSAFGDARGLDRFPGFLASADYVNWMTAPSGAFFNYADSRAARPPQPALFWFATELRRPDLIRFELSRLAARNATAPGSDERTESRHHPLALLWWKPASSPAAPPPPLHWSARGETPVAVHRSSWDDPDALYLAVKGGRAAQSHGHLDAGSFVLEADGVRWAVDPGMQDYLTLPALGGGLWDYSPGSPRWNVFRLGAESHNILRFDHAAPDVNGHASLLRSGPDPDGGGSTVLDLSPVYAAHAREVRRTLRLHPDRRITLDDTWTFAPGLSARVTSQWLTHAEVELLPRAALLRQDGRTLRIDVLAPSDATLAVDDVSAPPAPWDAPNPGLRRLRISSPSATTAPGRLLLQITPGNVER